MVVRVRDLNYCSKDGQGNYLGFRLEGCRFRV